MCCHLTFFLPTFFVSDSAAGLQNMVLDSSAAMGSNKLQEKDAVGALGHDLSNGNSSNLEAARHLAKRLYHLDKFKRSDVAKHLGKKYVLMWGHMSCCSCYWFGGVHSWMTNFSFFPSLFKAMNSASLWPKNTLSFLISQAWRWTSHSGICLFANMMFLF